MLDFGAHKSLVDEAHYQNEFLLRTSRRLAQRLLNALNPLCTKSLSDAKASELSKTFETIFASALKFKTFAMTSNFKCEFVWPAHNAVFDESCMEEMRSSTGKDRHYIQSRTKRVTLVLSPGLRVAHDSRMLVDYCGFVQAGDQGLANTFLVLRAVVMTVELN